MEPESQDPGSEDSQGADDFLGRLVGSYRVDSLRSRHGNCEVWTALHRPTEMEVVAEIYRKSGDDKRLVEEIIRKIDLSVDLAGSKVLHLLEVIDTEDAILLIYEYYSSQTLMEYILNCPLNGKEFQRLFRSLVKIVHGLHRDCFFHGTLSTDSFVLTRQKKVKLKDAPSCHRFLRSREEPARFDAMLSKASDVWSLGTLIYRLISHQLDTLLSARADSGQPETTEAVGQIVSELDPGLADLLSRMTDQNPAARIGTSDCLRHPYMTRLLLPMPDALRGRGRRAAASAWPRISLDVVRFLSAATGAPEADLAAAAVANDLSSWCAAYWLTKERLTTGRGLPPMAAAATTPEQPPDVVEQSQEVALGAEQRESAGTADEMAAAGAPQGDYKRTVTLLRGRRLGLSAASPRTVAMTTTTAATATITAALARQPQPQPPQQKNDWDASLGVLPPITVRSAGQSERSLTADDGNNHNSGGRRGHQHGHLQRQQQQQSLTSRYLSRILRQEQEEASAAARPVSGGGGSSGIRVRVRNRARSGQRQTLTVAAAASPRQPPNSRTEIAPIDRAAVLRGAAASAASAAAAAAAAASAAATGESPRYIWENAFVRWPQWQRSRAI